jgi:hypothetical protein
LSQPKTTSVTAAWIASAPRDLLFNLVKDQSTWMTWTDIQGFELERPGDAEPNGVGAIRKITASDGSEIRERIIEVVDGRLIRYELLSGLPVAFYQGLTEFSDEPDGRTLVRWTSTFAPERTEDLSTLSLFLNRVVRKMVRQVSLAAETPKLLEMPVKRPHRPLTGKHAMSHDLPRYQRLY